MAVLAVKATGWILSSSARFLRTMGSLPLSSRLLGLQDRWQQLNRIQTDLLDTGFTYEALDRSAIPEKHRLLHNSYTALLKSVIEDRSSRANDVIFVFDSICARYPPSKSDLMLMIQWFRTNRDPDNAIKILQTMFHFGWPLEPKACNQVINVVANASGSKEARKLLDQLVSIGFTPDYYTYASMINAAAVERDADLAEYWFQQYFEHDPNKDNVVVYGALMKAYLRAGQLEKCMAMIDGAYPVQPNVVMYCSAIEACRRAKRFHRCLELYGSLISQGISPTVLLYNQLIDASSSSGDLQSAMKLYDDMKSRGLSPDICTFTTILKGHLIELETEMKLRPSNSRRPCNKLPNIARSLISEAQVKYGVIPDLAMYTTLVNIFTQAGHTTDALLCVIDMLVVGIKPDMKLLSAVLSCLSNLGSYHQCWHLYCTMLRVGISPNIHCYQAIISSLRNHPSRAADVLRIIEELKARNVVPDVKLYCTIMQVLGRANQVELAIQVLTEAIRLHPKYSRIDWCSIVIAAIKSLPNTDAKSNFWQRAASVLPFSEPMYSPDLSTILQSINVNEDNR